MRGAGAALALALCARLLGLAESAEPFCTLRAGGVLKTGCSFAHTNLRGRDLSRVTCPSCDFSHADLRGANLRLADLRGALFVSARLGEAILDDARLAGANFMQACGTRMPTATHEPRCRRDVAACAPTATDEPRCRRYVAQFGPPATQASAADISLEGADLVATSAAGITTFRRAVLVGARMGGARLRHVDLSQAETNRAHSGHTSDSRRACLGFTVAPLIQVSMPMLDANEVEMAYVNLTSSDLMSATMHKLTMIDSEARRCTRPPLPAMALSAVVPSTGDAHPLPYAAGARDEFRQGGPERGVDRVFRSRQSLVRGGGTLPRCCCGARSSLCC